MVVYAFYNIYSDFLHGQTTVSTNLHAILTKLVVVNERCGTQNDKCYLLVRLDRLTVAAGVLVFRQVSLVKTSVSCIFPNKYNISI